MFRPLSPRPARRGHTLVVTLVMLALLAVLGIAAVYFAKDQAERARIGGLPGPDAAFYDNGMGPLNVFLGSLTYDVQDGNEGLLNSMRGHSLMATMYGRSRLVAGNWVSGGTIDAWNGTGTFDEMTTFAGVLRRNLVNHQVFPGQTTIYDPEFRGERLLAAPLGSSGAYVPKNIAYTYPDLKDYFLAVQCPATGEILVPSFSRRDGFGTLSPGNPNWTNSIGKFLTLRPRPAEHPNFPVPPPNADGSTIGDVQNLPGAFRYDPANAPNGLFSQRNDSIWIDIGMQPFTLPNGKRVKALVAPLILDLDGRLSLNIHGNRLNAGAHTSGVGMGPWDVNLEKALAANATTIAEAQALVGARGLPTTRSGISAKSYAQLAGGGSGQQLPVGSAVPWTSLGGSNGTNSLFLPGQGTNPLYANHPQYSPTFVGPVTPGYDSTNAAVTNHPALYSPSEWQGYTRGDLKTLSSRYAAPPSAYATMAPGTYAQTALRGTAAFPPIALAATPSSYRLDPAHTNRNLFTTQSTSLDRAGLTPGTGQTQATNAALGAIDVNRRLADYRANPAQPLSPTNMAAANLTLGSVATLRQAEIDRQLFAQDIFARLLVSTNAAGATVNTATGVITITEPVGGPNYNNLRALAQLAGNIVDYIDDDDVSTPFIWNPVQTAPPDPFQGYATFTVADLSNRVVFGVEKPRLVLNEVYSEVTNDPADATFTTLIPPIPGAMNPAHVRFWLELQNPTSTPYTAGVGPLGTGAVNVYYTAADGVAVPYNPYRVEIVREAQVPGGATSLLRNPADPNHAPNVTGSLNGTTPDIIFDFSTAGALRSVAPANATAAGGMVLCAANVPMVRGPEFNPTLPPNTINATAVPPAIGGSTTALSYPVVLANALNAPQHVVLLRRLANPYLPFNVATNPFVTVDTITNVRTADRVLRTNGSNMNRTARTTAAGAGFEPNSAPAMAMDPELRPQSTGKVQPYTAWAVVGTAAAPPSFPTSLVLYQDPPTASVGVGPDGVRHTFARQNSKAAAAPAVQTYVPAGMVPATLSGDTLMTPFDWLVHLDRPLINQMELLHVTTGKPHEFTLRSVVPNGGGTDVTKFSTSAQTAILNNTFPELYRALDLLRTQPYGHQTALGGRVHGRINLNTIQDIRVWRALFDAQPNHGFTAAQVDAMWTSLMTSRSPNTVPGGASLGLVNMTAADPLTTFPTPAPRQSVYDLNVPYDGLSGSAYDRPFLPLGVSKIAAGGGSFAFNGGTGLDDTILRTMNQTNPPTPIANPLVAIPGAGTHPYQQAEAVRKILNNTTTVSHSFAVWVTVGYFEVEAETPIAGVTLSSGGPAMFAQLGREYYREVPGDTRHKFFAIVDRSNVGLAPDQVALGNMSAHAQVRPFFTTVEANASAGTNTIQISTDATGNVYSDGTPVAVMPAVGSTLVIGTGANTEIVTVQSVSAPVNGVATVTISSVIWTQLGPLGPPLPTFTKNHHAGESVSNILPGNPGPQPNFDVNQPMYQPVVPHWSRIP